MKHSSNSNAAENLMSLENDGGDIVLLPPKKKKEKKGKNLVLEKLNAKPKLSKSQKRRLKKLEEEKEKETLLLKSIETLEKYKLKDDVFSLMWSSRNLGKVETGREKRRREVEFSKAGLELPHDEKASTKRKRDNASENIDIEVDDDDICLPAIDVHPDTNMKSSHDELGMSDGQVGVTFEVVANDNFQASLPEFEEKSTQSSPIEEIVIPTEAMDAGPSYNPDSGNKQSNCTLSGIRVAKAPVTLSRPKEVDEQRKGLPIVMYEQDIMEAINNVDNLSLIICGETGCGKTTQVPQFLYEGHFGSPHSEDKRGMIGVTQPRRVAVLATAKRVAYEMGLRLGKEVGFQVRHDRKVGENCSIKFMTDGILLREVQNDFLLQRYSIIILDEAHERSLNTDILIGMLSRVIQIRQEEFEKQQKKISDGETIESQNRIYPLRLVLMSATLRVDDFVSGNKIFRNPPPIIEVPTRQYPVTMHFSKKTEIVDYIGQAFKKVLSIHKRLPRGGILVFVTGQREVELLCQRLSRASRKLVENAVKVNNEASSIFEEKPIEDHGETYLKEISEAYEFQGTSGHEITERFNSHEEEDHGDFPEDASDTSCDTGEESDLEYFSDGEEADENLASIKAAFEALSGKKVSDSKIEGQGVPQMQEGRLDQSRSLFKRNDKGKGYSPGQLHVLPLYAMLPASSQLRVFDKTRDGERLVVVATNVAETSLTIPGIKYVVDTGREKVKNYNSSTGMETYEIQWISKASAAQRAGRAGRTGPGHCYRLYSSAAFNNLFPDFSTAEISKVPVDGVLLLLKSMGIKEVAEFPFPTPPETTALIEAERCLKDLEALDKNGSLTALGRAMARYPMGPRQSRMLLTVIQIMQKAIKHSRANLVLAFAVSAAAALSSSNPFLRLFEDNNEADDKNHAEEADSEGNKKAIDKEEKLKKKKLKQNAKLSREKFSHPTSDALTVAFALQSFELSECLAEFCSENALHYKTMEEMSKLRKQLLQLVFSSRVNDSHDFSWAHGTIEDVESAWKVSCNKHPLLPNEEDILGQAICAGWADRVAKRIRGPSLMANGERITNTVRYQACMVNETVFLHRWSSISKSAPEFLVYSELLQGKRPYIHGATSVKSSWLPQYARKLCSFSAPLLEPKPFYDPMADQVLSWVSPTFGQHRWQLPLHGLPDEDDSRRVEVFSYCLLDGQVLPCLKGVRDSMASPPAILLKSEGKGLKRVGNLLSKLNRKGRIIDSRAKLRKTWEENPRELFVEIRDWFQEGFRGRFEQLWEEMHRQVLSEPKQKLKKKIKKSKREV